MELHTLASTNFDIPSIDTNQTMPLGRASMDGLPVYLSVNGVRDELVRISPAMSVNEVRALMCAAAGMDFTHDVVAKLTKTDGTLIVLGPSIPPNTSSTPSGPAHVNYAPEVDIVLQKMQTAGKMMSEMQILKKEVAECRAQLEGRGPNNVSDQFTHPATRRVNELRLSHLEAIPPQTYSAEVMEALKNPGFDVWKYNKTELIGLFEVMYEEFKLFDRFKIDPVVFRRFIAGVSEGYNDNPFHNFKHCFCVTQMCYAILHVSGVHTKLSIMEKLCLLTACIGHDLDHPGFNNAYQINAKTELATVYNDQSPLENHHCAVLFTLLKQPETNFLSKLTEAEWKEFRTPVVQCILATDMAIHGQIMAKFKGYTEAFNYDDPAQKLLLLQMIVKCSDISNEVRPKQVSEPWVDCLLEEFFHQSDTEKEQGLPTAPFMDRQKVTKPGAQVGFIGFVMIPLYELAAKVLPAIEEPIIGPIRKSLDYYKAMSNPEPPKS
ncbi:hypothetical protein SmJEL517_g01478 [Synchytrium microbalum]|uniref:Phosphodiesterase n=1 Tax=Synchytrium microbalum TaxID=1806994 RepID=A0A507CEX0_9FUNG|nr:uncharacterized protein SmJEL517_g01478 [Synchytrium microbalum]TPX36125.1 hypothetical protein SmJEL517_g01478 [Synchytrium microbalum]